MNLLQFDSPKTLAECASKLSIGILKATITEYEEATWVLAGGSTPAKAYEVISGNYTDKLSWQNVWFCMGDERHVPQDNSDSNWRQVEDCLLSHLDVNRQQVIQPKYEDELSVMANMYIDGLYDLPKVKQAPRFDLVWLGMGEDGHTLSLFPEHNLGTDELVLKVENSPKPPSQRISLSLKAMTGTQHCLILVSGESKSKALEALLGGDSSLPIARVIKTIEESGGEVTLLADTDACSLSLRN